MMGFFFFLFKKVSIACRFSSTAYTPSVAQEHRGSENATPHPQAYSAQIFQSLSQMNFVSFMTPVNIIFSNLSIFKVSLLKKKNNNTEKDETV